MSSSPDRRSFISRAATWSHRGKSARQRRGKIVVMTAFLMTVLLGMVAFSVDVGYMAVTRTEIQICTDAAALAGASGLVDGPAEAISRAKLYVGKNKVGGQTLGASNATITTGSWNEVSKVFTAGGDTPNAIKINTVLNNAPLFFGRTMNRNNFNTSAQSIATYQPRDIALVLDYSGSMAYDSQFRNMSLIGKPAIEANLLQIWQELGSPKYGTMNFTPVAFGDRNSTYAQVKNKFGLNIAYPLPGGSWNEYIDYVQDNTYLNSAGYRCKYGMLTWIHYQMEKEGGSANSPGWHVTSQQPLTALKDAVDEFLGFLSENSTDDRVALSIYTYTDNKAILEQALTKTYTQISSKVQGRQAGHYVGSTNISAGMTKGRLELQNNGRAGVSKLLILMTDGEANLPTGTPATDKQKVREEAALCAAAKIPVVTITVGAGADTGLMQEVASVTGGACFIVPGGQPIAAVQEQLEQVFAQVAADRPLKLVQ